MPLPRNPKLKFTARELRREMTPEEKHLWYDFLAHHPTTFHRQFVVDSFIVDFYCHSANLVLEVDGGGHYTDEKLHADEERTSHLNALGIDVLRFTNTEIRAQFAQVCAAIDEAIKRRARTEDDLD